jgi:hypothetical protein
MKTWPVGCHKGDDLMIDLSTFAGLAEMDLGPLQPKPTSVEGNQMEASVALASHDGGKVDAISSRADLIAKTAIDRRLAEISDEGGFRPLIK